MADDGEAASKPKPHRPQETFHRAQETPVEHKFPNITAGIVPRPRAPKSLNIRRNNNSFGFTLRHFIVYPPNSIAESDGRYAAVGALSEPMDTIFVKQVKDPGPAQQAGLRQGDRLIKVNNVSVTNKSYAQVVQLIANTPELLQLLVVPKEDDILQRYFAETAYNPVSNQDVPRFLNDRQAAQHFLTQNLNTRELQVDALSWRSLQNSYGYDRPYRSQRSIDNLDLRDTASLSYYPHEAILFQRARAQPQVPPLQKMGRRASDGCALSDYPQLTEYEDMETIQRESQNQDLSTLRYPNNAGCRLSLDAGRRESSSSLGSFIVDGSKDSLISCDSTSTMTGHETDDSARSWRLRKSLQQKEAFLKMTPETAKPREFYSRPRKFEKPTWPPMESPSKIKPTHHNFQRVKNEIETERELHGGVPGNVPQQKDAKSPNEDKIKEAAIAPSGLDNGEQFNGSFTAEGSDVFDEKRIYPPSLQMVHKRARQFESGRPLPEDDPVLSNRTSYHRSELARLSSKKVVPNVTERAQEFEIRSEPRREATPSSPRKIQRDSRSLESNESSSSTGSVGMSIGELVAKRLSGNVMISTGSKYIHCPPPSEYGKPTDSSENQANRICARSNSAESWVVVDAQNIKPENKRISRQDAISEDGSKTKDHQVDDPGQIPYADLPPLIPESVEHMHFTPSVSITPAPTVITPQTSRAIRPNQLDLEGPVRPARHLKPPASTVDTPMRRPVSPVIGEDKPAVVKRRTKNTNLADDERTTRRVSYLMATEGGRMHIDSDLSDGDVSPQVLRSAHRRWRPPLFPGDIQQLRRLFEDAASSLGGSSSSSASLDREKITASPLDKEKHALIKEGQLHCKITEIDGKRSGDRSWKQIWAALKGPKLFLHKDKHHQSPMGTSDAVEHSLASGVDMRASEVRVAEDYTKRKHVLRVSSVNPCRSEFLLQAESTEDFTDWFKALQEQMATNTEAEAKFDPLSGSTQQAVPQTNPASTSILVQGNARLSPQPSKSKSSTSRNRSPTGQSPVSKTRKPSQVIDPATSPKVKTWRGRVVKQFRKMHGASSPSSPTAPEGSTFGVPLDQCLASSTNPYVPRLVEVCTDIVDAKGLQTVGIYRVPGNNASITALTEEINRNYDEVPQEDPRWNDLHVVSSLLKAYFRKIPDSLVTSALYPSFIKADKIEDPKERSKELKRLIKSLPPHNYHTLKHIMLHLKKVCDNAGVNKMEAKNLAIVFGPNIVRPEDDNMETLVSNMTHQCKIVETLLNGAKWFFCEDDTETLPVPAAISDTHEESELTSQALLLDNISKFEAFKEKEKNGALFSSIISAAQRKVKRKTTKGSCSLNESKEEETSPNDNGGFPSGSFSHTDLKDSTDGKTSVIPTTVTEMEKVPKSEKVPWFNYSTDKEDFRKRIENFRQETQAMLQMPRNVEISVNNIPAKSQTLSTSVSNVSNTRPSTKPVDSHLLKTHSASNVFSRTTTHLDNRHSLDNSYTVQYTNSDSEFGGSLRDTNRNESIGTNGRFVIRRGSSVENVNVSSTDLNANGAMKKVRYENESEMAQRLGSSDSLHKVTDDATDLTSVITLFDKKLKASTENLLSGDGLPYADESPEKTPRILSHLLFDKENVPNLNDLYRNPSLHKNQYTNKSNYLHDTKAKESNNDTEKDEDSTMSPEVPDKEKNISNKLMKNKTTNSILKRSESLNKPERTVSPLNNKLKRSESLNKPGDKLKRSDSLTKTEKTESNLNKRREIATSVRRSKDVTKLKRKNGMPDRSIKRRHTVGGTKDPDKVTWWDNKKYQEEVSSNKENKEKNLRTSSPDLSSTRREKLCFEINLIGPENMVVALKQHLMGARPQSFPDTAVFKVPLESHV